MISTQSGIYEIAWVQSMANINIQAPANSGSLFYNYKSFFFQ